MTWMLLELNARDQECWLKSVIYNRKTLLFKMSIVLELINTALDYNESTKVLTSKAYATS